MDTYEVDGATQLKYFLAFLEPRMGAAALATTGGGQSRLMVFVHGGHGDFINTWTNSDAGTYWPELVRDDAANFGALDMAMFDYYSPLLRDAKGVSELAKILRKKIAKSQAADYDEIVFVAHSLGGVVTRQLLVDLDKDKDPLLGKIRLVVSMTCAYGGSALPNTLFELGSENEQFEDVSVGSSYLTTLNAAWDAVRQALNPQQKSRPFIYSVRGTSDMVVTNEHAELGCDTLFNPVKQAEVLFPKQLLQAHPGTKGTLGHTDIVKPDDINHAAHLALREAFRLTIDGR